MRGSPVGSVLAVRLTEVVIAEIGLGIGAAALALPVAIEAVKRPRIEMRLEPWVPQTPVAWTFATVWVRVKPLPHGISALLVRETATSATATVEFRQGGRRVLPEVPARWSAQREPVEAEVKGYVAGQPVIEFKYTPEAVPRTKVHDLAPGRWEEIAVAVLRDDGEAYAFGAESYGWPEWRRGEWKLERGEYEVTVRIESAGPTMTKRLRLDNLTTDFSRFRLREFD
jgi:hypothetical protein